MAQRRNITNTLKRLAAVEHQFLEHEFLAPMLPGGIVHVRLAGVVCQLRVEPADFSGFGVFQPVSHLRARLVRPARLSERQRYLELFPQLELIACGRDEETWVGSPAHLDDRRRLDGELPIRLAEEIQLFETVQTRCDGAQCWFDRLDERGDPASAAFLRSALADSRPPDKVRRRGLSGGQRRAYVHAYARLMAAERDRVEDRLRAALAHAGADLRSYVEQRDGYRLHYRVDGRRHVSVVNKNDLSVQVAGICLSGTDKIFDLHSLVGVLREAHREEIE